MARTTRSKPKAKEPSPEPPVSDVKPLPASTSNPPKLFVLPKDTTPDARIVTLDNPANGIPSRYFFCPQKGFYEFTRISAPKKDCRSWLITGSEDGETKQEEQDEGRIGSGYITKAADMFVATPIDILFLILPALAPTSAKDTKQHFLALDEYLDKLSASSRHWRALLSHHASLKDKIEKRMRAVCDSVDAGDETMYRLSQPKLLAILLKKAERMSAGSLPASLEDKFVKQKLEIPIMTMQREASSLSGTTTSTTTATETTESNDTTLTTPDESAPKLEPQMDAPAEQQQQLTTPPSIPPLLRTHTSLTYLTTTYLPFSLHPPLLTYLTTSPAFIPLHTHLAAISTLKSSALALRAISDNMSRKRAYEDDDERVAEREEKKRKKEEEEKKRKSEGRGVKALKKVDTSGMKKMSAFFGVVAKKKT